MNVSGFTQQQLETLLDLLVLGMYVDGKLASCEEARVKELITAMGGTEEYDRNRVFDGAVNRVRRYSETRESARGYAARLAAGFTEREQKMRVFDLLNDLLSADGEVTAEENKFLAAISEVFRG